MRRYWIGLLVLGWLGVGGSRYARAQQQVRDSVLVSIPGADTLKAIRRESVLSVPIVYLPDSLIRDTLRYEYTKIKNVAYRSSLTKELYKLIFVNPKYNRINVMRTENSEERFQEYAGKTIRDIRIKILPPYGTSVYDTTATEQDLGWLRAVANGIHIKTANRVILKQLTIKPGMKVSPFELVQNEILLRHLSYIDDATLLVREDKQDPSLVDITVICKDEFSWGAEISSNFINSARITLVNKNFFRLGHVVEYGLSYKGRKDQKWGNMLDYRIGSIWGTHFDFRGYYRNDYLEKILLGQVQRLFVTSSVKWAGGVELSRAYHSENLPDINIERQKEVPFNYHSYDVWLGKSFILDTRHRYNRNLYLTARFYNTIFNDRPRVSSDSNQFYYNRQAYFGSIVYRKLRYYKANLIYDFGRTEDIPTGFYSAFIFGYENNEFQNSGYIGYECRYSHFDKQTERFYAFDAGIASYINDSGFERGLLKVGLHHISNLLSLGSFRYRFYNDVNYITGFRRYPSDYVRFGDSDILGFDSDTLQGNQKLSMSLSTTVFLPYIKKGFRMSVTTFLDLGALVPENKSIFKGKTYWGMGLAVNLRNDNIVFKNISLRLSFYPKVPADVRHFEASMSGNLQNGFYDYEVNKPQVIRYQ